MDYKGEKCPVCGESFTHNDDIVVCPDCGTPHHRSCYAAENKCANEGYHSTGMKWKKTADNKPLYKICPICHFSNGSAEENCQRCGAELKDVTAVPKPERTDETDREQMRDPFSGASPEDIMDPVKFLGLDPEEDMGGATMQEVIDFVGPNTIYYIPKFKRIKDDGVKTSFNIFSFIFPTLYFANRKMWGWAILAAILGVIFNLPADLLPYIEEFPEGLSAFLAGNKPMLEAISDIGIIADIMMRAVFCFFANWFYFRFSMNSLKKHKMNGRSVSAVKAAGGIKPVNMLIITAIKYGIGLIALSVLYYGYEMITTMNDFSTLCLM